MAMRHFKLTLLLPVLGIFILGGCNNEEEVSVDQQRIETLAGGAWTLTSTTVDGTERDFGGTLVSHTQTHGLCTVEDGDCSGSNAYVLELADGTIVTGGSTFTYKIHEEGKKMTIKVSDQTTNGETSTCTNDCESVFDIKEWSDTKHVLETTDNDGHVIVRTMERL